MENKYKWLSGIIGIVVMLFFPLLGRFELQGAEIKSKELVCSGEAELSIDDGQEENNWNTVYFCTLQKRGMSSSFIENIARLMAVTFVLSNLFHLTGVLFLQGKGRVFVCFKSCVFYPAHFLCELFIRQKSDGKKRVCLS